MQRIMLWKWSKASRRRDKDVASGVGSYSAGTVVVEVVVRIDCLEDVETEGSIDHDSDIMVIITWVMSLR